jgi:hypothetical protein
MGSIGVVVLQMDYIDMMVTMDGKTQFQIMILGF